MAVYLSPGVYIEEIPGGARPIEGVATSVCAFVGNALRGPVNDAVRISSLDEYRTLFGPITSEDDAMGISVFNFYQNGGRNAYICRVAGPTALAASDDVLGEGAVGGADTPTPVLTISAASEGDWGNDLFYRLIKPANDAATFTLEIGTHDGAGDFVLQESFAGLTMRAGDDSFAIRTVNAASTLVSLSLGTAADPEAPQEQFQEAVLIGGDTGGANDHFTTSLAGNLVAALNLNINGRGSERITVDLTAVALAGANHDADAGLIATAVEDAIHAHSTLPVFQAITVGYAAQRFTITSPEAGADASLTVGPGVLAETMALTETARTTLVGTQQPATPTRFNTEANLNSMTGDIVITLDGQGPVTVAFDPRQVTTGGVDNTLDGQAIAAGLQAAIRAASGGAPALANVTVVYGAAAPVTRRFVFTSGTGSARAPGAVIEDGAVAAFLGIQTSTAGVTVTPGRSVTQGTAPVMPLQDLGLNDQGVPLAGGQDDLPNAGNYADFYGTILRKRRDVTMIVLPGAPMEPTGPTAIIDATIAHCEAMQNRMVILDPPAGVELDDPADVDGLSLPTSTYTTLYYPWVRVTNPLFDVDSNPAAARTLLAQPSAFAAGIWTRTDARRNVAKAPAGLEAELRGATAFEFEVEEAEQGVLNPLGVNCFRRFPQPVVWGARTLATRAAPEWRYVPVRRTAIFIEQSIYNGIQWAVFEPNDHPLWSALRGSIEAFMDGLFRSNHFQGRTANEAYFVRCNLGDTMTQGDIDRGQVIVVVGFAPLKPAEFVVVRIQQQVNQQ